MAVETSDLFDQWFRIADTDRDGRISGSEAVTFFQRAQLPQDTLFKVWKLVAGDSSHLTKPQFWASLRLVSLAQQHGGPLPETEARSTLIGVGPALPPPVLAGLEVQAPAGASTATTRGAPASQPSTGLYPPLQEHTMQHYLQMFSQLDRDRDGMVQGGDCFGAFMQWGLPRQTLKDVWQVVAGDESFLTQQRFVTCLYFMDLAKQGRPVPSQLPPAPFPPGYHTGPAPPVQAAEPFNLGAVQQIEHDVFSKDLPTPTLPQKAVFAPPPARERPSQAPQPDPQRLQSLDPLERQRLQNEAVQAATMEAELRKTQSAAAEAAAKEKFFREALQELTLFKSRTSAALLQAQEQLHSAKAEADAMEANYQSAWAGAQATQSQSATLLEQLSEAKAQKAECRRKLEDLQKDIEALSSISQAQVQEEQELVADLLREVAEATAERERRLLEKDAVFASKGTLQEEVSKLNTDLESTAAAIDETQAELDELVKQLEGGNDSAALRLQACLRKSAAMHQLLVDHARRENIAIPEDGPEEDAEGADASPSDDLPILWPSFIAAGARDWADEAMQGPEIVDSLPDAGRLLNPSAAPSKDDAETEGPQENGHAESTNEPFTSEPQSSDTWAAF